MASNEVTFLWDMDDTELTLGPAMQALPKMRRKFVLAMLSNPFGAHWEWAVDAGYSNASEAAKVRAHQILQDPRVQPACLEVSRAAMGTMGPILASSGLLKIAADPDHPQHVKALELIANRVGLHETQQIEVTHRDLTGDAVLERIRALAERHGLDAEKLLGANASRETKVIEHKPAEDKAE